jgi:hypothetical protein
MAVFAMDDDGHMHDTAASRPRAGDSDALRPRETSGGFGHVVASIAHWRHYGKQFWLSALVLFLVELGCSILGAPSPQLLEMAVCRKYPGTPQLSGDATPSANRCKLPEVQVQLSVLLTTLSSLSMFGGEESQAV